MPKIVDNYVLQRKIGSGQFGDVFKGYNKLNNTDIAVQVIKRELLKGKFNELLQNEIRVLRTCNNENIIKLYDIQKTANNFYLILEYCNEGDLMVYLKEKKTLPEDEAIEYLVQIFNAFKTLTKNKIMHRDFKLANILKHNGNLKIADFGFAKLLGQEDLANTMLGSPLNMAPEVLNGTEYNNKADIWSIGTVFYELLFGKPPYTAANMIDLIQNIQNKPLEIPRRINNVSEATEDALRKMLVVDSKKRIDWEDLFQHKINYFLEDKIKKDLEDTLKSDGLAMNMSRFYIQNNMVIDHPSEIEKKEEVNNFAINMAKNGNNKDGKTYNGALIKRKVERDQEVGSKPGTSDSTSTKSGQERKDTEAEDMGPDSESETSREQEIKTRKRNANRLLHERNIYVFLASVAEDAMNNATILKNAEFVGFLLVKKLVQTVEGMLYKLSQKNNLFNLEMWNQFLDTKDFKDIFSYIEKEYDVFKMYYQSMYDKLASGGKIKSISGDQQLKIALSNSTKDNIEKVLGRMLKEYLKELIPFIKSQMKNTKQYQNFRQIWTHADRVIDCLMMRQVFVFEDGQSKVQFNFKTYYGTDEKLEILDLIQKVEDKMGYMK